MLTANRDVNNILLSKISDTTANNTEETGSRLPYDTAKSIIEDAIDIIVHIGRINGKRRMTSLYWKDYEKVNAYMAKGEK